MSRWKHWWVLIGLEILALTEFFLFESESLILLHITPCIHGYLSLWVVGFYQHVNSISNHWKLTFGKRSEVIHLHVDKENQDFVLHCQWCLPFSPFLTSDIHQKLFAVAFWWISLSMSLDLICVALLLCLLFKMRSLSVNHPCCGTGVFCWNSL